MQDREQIEQMLDGWDDDTDVVLVLKIPRTEIGGDRIRSIHRSIDGLMEFAQTELMSLTRTKASVEAKQIRD